MDDLISRAAAKAALVRYADSVDATNVLADWLIQIIRDLPAVAAPPLVHSFWHWDHDGYVCCNNCKFPLAKTRVNCAGQDKYIYLTTKYCSNCGAKMDEEE